MSEYIYDANSGELYHYGVLGMKWGVHRSIRKSNANSRLERKALKWDKKSAKLQRKAEKTHAEQDLEQSNRQAVKSAKYAKKAAATKLKALKSDNDFKKDRYLSKAAKLDYKSARAKTKGDRLSKITGYSSKAMKLSIKSDKVAAKAAKARMKMANNQRYINKMNQKTSSLSTAELEAAKSWVKGWTTQTK